MAGLGNPGKAYENSRHNMGFMVLDEISRAFSIPIGTNKFGALIGRGVIENKKVILAKPLKYMNLSGIPVHRIATYFRILSEDILIVHDDMDLAFGRIKIKEKGGHGGHKGIKSIIDAFGGGSGQHKIKSFGRLRIGIGHPESKIGVTDYVLGRFTSDERVLLDRIIDRAREAVEAVLYKGTKKSMNEFNKRTLI